MFNYLKSLDINRINGKRVVKIKNTDKICLKFKIAESHRYNCVISNLKKNCFKESKNEKFNFIWLNNCKPEHIKDLVFQQRVNHFPHSQQLGRKDMMWKNYLQLKRRFPTDNTFSQCPMSYIFPQDYNRFKIDQLEEKDPKQMQIVKPSNQACGRGIKIITKKHNLKNKQNLIVSN